MAFAPCRKRAKGPGGSNWFQSRTSCWNPAALIREVHFQVVVPSCFAGALGCPSPPPSAVREAPEIQNFFSHWFGAGNQVEAGKRSRSNSSHLLRIYLLCACHKGRCFANTSHFYNHVFPTNEEKVIKGIITITSIIFQLNSYWVLTIHHTLLKHFTCHLPIYHHINPMTQVLLWSWYYR